MTTATTSSMERLYFATHTYAELAAGITDVCCWHVVPGAWSDRTTREGVTDMTCLSCHAPRQPIDHFCADCGTDHHAGIISMALVHAHESLTELDLSWMLDPTEKLTLLEDALASVACILEGYPA